MYSSSHRSLFSLFEPYYLYLCCLQRYFLRFSETALYLLTRVFSSDTFFVASYETISDVGEFFDSVVVVDETKLVFDLLIEALRTRVQMSNVIYYLVFFESKDALLRVHLDVKLLRAHGGCPGTRTDEGRDHLRKAMTSWR